MTIPIDQLPPDTPPANASVAQTRSSGAPETEPDPPQGTAVEELDFRLSPRVTNGVNGGSYERSSDDPLYRPLRVFALDPSASVLEGAIAVVNVPFEPLERGPTGTLLRVIDDGYGDEDAVKPLDLEDPRLLVSQGKQPSVTDSAFRAQMAYAVCSTTYAAFRHALGREVSWGFDRGGGDDANRLIIRSCVSGVENAYYDPARGELQLGAFEADARPEGRNVGKGRICTALIHDIVAHEMSHALLDGLRARFMYPSNADVLAFHEAFADIVAIFQRFTYRDVVRAALEGTHGEMGSASVLTRIGQQFAQAAGFGTALRSAVLDSRKQYGRDTEPHKRGEILVAAVFRAFAIVYKRKASPLLRLATNGTGLLRPGRVPDLLGNLLAELASKLAGHFLSICIRAIDYCPPVDITFGEYLRAVITADSALVADDPWAYREAWVDGFRHHGIKPSDVVGLTQDALQWRGPDQQLPAAPRLTFAELHFNGDPGRPASEGELLTQGAALGALVGDPRYCATFGLARSGDADLDGDEVDVPNVESVRSSRRVGPDGQIVFDLVAEVTQRRVVKRKGQPQFDFYGGATLLIDPKGRVRYLIRKSIVNRERLEKQRQFVKENRDKLFLVTPICGGMAIPRPEGFRLLHEITRESTSGQEP